MKTKLICDIRRLCALKKRLLISVILTILSGFLILFACDGIYIVWRLTDHPPFTLPFIILLALDLAVCAAFGVLCVCASLRCRPVTDGLVRCVLSFSLFLFWCPLALLARVYLLAFFAVMLSAAYLILMLACTDGKCLFCKMIGGGILAVMAYFAYISLALAFGI